MSFSLLKEDWVPSWSVLFSTAPLADFLAAEEFRDLAGSSWVFDCWGEGVAAAGGVFFLTYYIFNLIQKFKFNMNTARTSPTNKILPSLPRKKS